MHHRCKDNDDYVSRGIEVCLEWRSLNQFVKDMTPGYKPGLTIERIDNDGPYAPWNCRWATRFEQARNRRSNRLITFNGRTMPVKDWAVEVGIHYRTITARIDKLGWSEARALTEPVQQQI